LRPRYLLVFGKVFFIGTLVDRQTVLLINLSWEKGIKQGIERGEKQKAAKIAVNLIEKGVLDDQDISEMTELSVEEVRDLRKQ